MHLDWIVNRYNEKGSFILNDNRIYWFNGKRFEFWCLADGFRRIVFYQNSLYGCNINGFNFVYKQKKWNRHRESTSNTPLENLQYHYVIEHKINKRSFYKNGVYLRSNFKDIEAPFGRIDFIIPYLNNIYCFYCFGSGASQLYDTTNDQWHQLAHHNDTIYEVMLIKNEIYAFCSGLRIMKFNLKSWTTLDLKVPFKIQNNLFATSE